MRYFEGRIVAYSYEEFVELKKMQERFNEITDPSEWLMLNGVALSIIEEKQYRRYRCRL